MRQVIQSHSDFDESLLRVDRLRMGTARPFHGICIEQNSKYAQVQIRLFGSLAYRVHFLKLYAPTVRFAYTKQLDTGDEHIQQIATD